MSSKNSLAKIFPLFFLATEKINFNFHAFLAHILERQDMDAAQTKRTYFSKFSSIWRWNPAKQHADSNFEVSMQKFKKSKIKRDIVCGYHT